MSLKNNLYTINSEIVSMYKNKIIVRWFHKHCMVKILCLKKDSGGL